MMDSIDLRIPRPVLSEDTLSLLNSKMTITSVGDIVCLKYYKKGSILHITGEVTKINRPEKYLKVNKIMIKFDDLIEVY